MLKIRKCRTKLKIFFNTEQQQQSIFGYESDYDKFIYFIYTKQIYFIIFEIKYLIDR